MDLDYTFPKIRLGLCCCNLTLKYKNNVFSSRRKNLATILQKGLEDSEVAAKENLVDLLKMLLWAKNHGIDVMRISSELVPHGSNTTIIEEFGEKGEKYLSLQFAKPYLEIIGKIVKLEGIRTTFHPGQFVQIASPSISIFENSVREIRMHVLFLDLMKVDLNSVIVIHIGGTYLNKESTTRTFIERFKTIDPILQRRIVLENDEKSYDAQDVLEICKEVGRPMVFDIHHYNTYKYYNPDATQKSIDEMMPDILDTWTKLNIRPKFHLSEQMDGKPMGTHSLYIKEIPLKFLEIPSKYGVEIDIMIEAKGKEIAISKLYKKYPQLVPKFRKKLPSTIHPDALKDLKLSTKVKEKLKK